MGIGAISESNFFNMNSIAANNRQDKPEDMLFGPGAEAGGSVASTGGAGLSVIA